MIPWHFVHTFAGPGRTASVDILGRPVRCCQPDTFGRHHSGTAEAPGHQQGRTRWVEAVVGCRQMGNWALEAGWDH